MDSVRSAGRVELLRVSHPPRRVLVNTRARRENRNRSFESATYVAVSGLLKERVSSSREGHHADGNHILGGCWRSDLFAGGGISCGRNCFLAGGPRGFLPGSGAGGVQR